MKPILVLNGPNLNLLGTREPEIYGSETLDDIKALCEAKAKSLGLSVDFKQSNSESDLVQMIQDVRETHAGIVINAAAYTHTSVAIADALKAVNLPIIEVHLSNVHQREAFRHHSYISPIAHGVICGLGSLGYTAGIEALANIIKT